MGLCNAPATFTAMMNEELEGSIDKYCAVYLDDILIFHLQEKNILRM